MAPLPPWLLLLLVGFLGCVSSQEIGEKCLEKFKKGREDFVLDLDESVNDGATFISSPKLARAKDCVVACCKEPKCNVALMQGDAEEGSINSCFLFDCLYKKKYACRFVRKKGYFNFIQESVYESYLEFDVPPSKERYCLLALTRRDARPPSWSGEPLPSVQFFWQEQ